MFCRIGRACEQPLVTTENGKVNGSFIVWSLPDCEPGETTKPVAGDWWAELDKDCEPVWYQRWTEDGAIELKLSDDDPIYRLVANEPEGDLSSAEVYLEDQLIYSINITNTILSFFR